MFILKIAVLPTTLHYFLRNEVITPKEKNENTKAALLF